LFNTREYIPACVYIWSHPHPLHGWLSPCFWWPFMTCRAEQNLLEFWRELTVSIWMVEYVSTWVYIMLLCCWFALILCNFFSCYTVVTSVLNIIFSKSDWGNFTRRFDWTKDIIRHECRIRHNHSVMPDWFWPTLIPSESTYIASVPTCRNRGPSISKTVRKFDQLMCKYFSFRPVLLVNKNRGPFRLSI